MNQKLKIEVASNIFESMDYDLDHPGWIVKFRTEVKGDTQEAAEAFALDRDNVQATDEESDEFYLWLFEQYYPSGKPKLLQLLHHKEPAEFYQLKSVGAFIDSAGYIYPANADDTPDYNNPSFYLDMEADGGDPQEWNAELSTQDNKLVNAIVEPLKNGRNKCAGVFTVADDRRSIKRIDPDACNDGIQFVTNTGKNFVVYIDNDSDSLIVEDENQKLISRITSHGEYHGQED